MKKLVCILFLLCSVITYSQTFYSPVVVKKTFRVDRRVAIGGIDFTQDVTITADTILINNLDGTGNLLGIDVSGNVLRVTGAGTGGVSGLVPTEIVFGGATGLIDQDADFTFDDASSSVILNGLGCGYYAINGADLGSLNPTQLGVANATNTASLYADRLELYVGANGTLIYRQSGGSTYNINLPNANGINGQALRLNAGLNLEWYSPISLASFSATSPLNYNSGTGVFSLPITNNEIVFGNGTSVSSSADFTFDDATEIFDIRGGNFTVDGSTGFITNYGGAGPSDGNLLIGDNGSARYNVGILSSTDLTVGYVAPDLTLSYATGSILNADINGTAAIDATKIADGTVTSTEFQYINTLSSNAQTQLNGKGFTIIISGSQNTIADATNYYSGATQNNSGGTADLNRVYVPVNCTLTSAYGFFLNAGTLGSGESGTFYIRKNNTTDVTVSASVTTNATHNTFNGTGLSGSYSAGDYLEGKWLTPTYATNPSTCRWTVTLFFVEN